MYGRLQALIEGIRAASVASGRAPAQPATGKLGRVGGLWCVRRLTKISAAGTAEQGHDMGKKPSKTRAAGTARVAPPSTEPRDGFAMTDADIERSLLTGENAGALEDYFGPAQYGEVRALAQQAATRSARGGDRVIIVPGIMGSKLGYPRKLLPADLLWLDPIEIAMGKLADLALPAAAGARRIEPVGVILLSYLSLKYRLRLAGFDADFWPYDWRQSLPGLGKALAKLIDAEGRKVQIVAHSMGGLVARAALATVGANLSRIVMLGTPNFGSLAPVQAFRGVGDVVSKLAWLDRDHDAEQLADIFGTFSGLIEMIPAAGRSSSDLSVPANWPTTGKRPSDAALAAAKAVQDKLPQSKAGVDIVMIAGTGQETVVDAKLAAAAGQPSEFAYTISTEGDGTVPLRCALLPTADRTYYVAEAHGALPGNRQIQTGLPSILATGETIELKKEPTRAARPERIVRESELRALPAQRGGVPGARDKRKLIEEFAAPPPGGAATSAPVAGMAGAMTTGASSDKFSDMVIVGRGRQRRLEITLARGSITDADADIYVLGMFKNVDPAGAALAVDGLMQGALSEMVARRMFGANVGEISILPVGRHPMLADGIAFAGLGPFDGFDASVLEIVGENLVRTLVASRVDDFAVVPIGANSGPSALANLRPMIEGFLRGLKDSDTEQRFRGLTICEVDPARCDAIRAELHRLSGTALFDEVEVVFRERTLPSRMPVPDTRAGGHVETAKVYLIVREQAEQQGAKGLTASLLTSGAKAAIHSGQQPFDPDGEGELKDHLALLDDVADMSQAKLDAFGQRLGELVLADNVRQALATYAAQHLVVVHDAAASRIPWETLRIGEVSPALAGGLSHRYEAADLSVAKWLQRKQYNDKLSVLLVVNPTEDLAGAAKEGAQIREKLDKLGSSVKVRVLEGQQARKSELMRCFGSNEYDVVHYAGHAFFDPLQRTRSGLLCAGREVLSGGDLATIGNLPALMFFNACEAARVRGGSLESTSEKPGKSEEVRRNIGFAEALLRGGIANFIGTYWPVGDAAAEEFAGAFYSALLAGATLNDALLGGRKAVLAEPSPDWADYVFYGDPDFQLKVKT